MGYALRRNVYNYDDPAPTPQDVAYTHFPTDAAELKNALETTSAKVWLAPETLITVANDAYVSGLIQVAANVEMHSDGGFVDGNGVVRKGGGIFSPTLKDFDFSSPPWIFALNGTGIVFKGVHFQGPWMGPGANYTGSIAGCLRAGNNDANDYLIQNCFFAGWPHTAIIMRTPGRVAHCTFIANRRSGWGYGVWQANVNIGRVWLDVEACYFNFNRHSTAGSGHEVNNAVRYSMFGDDHRYVNAECHSRSGSPEGRGGIERLIELCLFRQGRYGDASSRNGNRNIGYPLPLKDEEYEGEPQGDGLVTIRKIWSAHHQRLGDDSRAGLRVHSTHVESFVPADGPNDPYKAGMQAVAWSDLKYQTTPGGVPEGAVLPTTSVVNYDGTTLSVSGSSDADGHAIDHHVVCAHRANQLGVASGFGLVWERFRGSTFALDLSGEVGEHRFLVHAVNEFGVVSDTHEVVWTNDPGFTYGVQVLVQHENWNDPADPWDFVVFVENVTQGSGEVEGHRFTLSQDTLGWHRIVFDVGALIAIAPGDQIKVHCYTVATGAIASQVGTHLVFVDGVVGFGFDVENGWFDPDVNMYDAWVPVSEGVGGTAHIYHAAFSGISCCESVDIRQGDSFSLGDRGGISQTIVVPGVARERTEIERFRELTNEAVDAGHLWFGDPLKVVQPELLASWFALSNAMLAFGEEEPIHAAEILTLFGRVFEQIERMIAFALRRAEAEGV